MTNLSVCLNVCDCGFAGETVLRSLSAPAGIYSSHRFQTTEATLNAIRQSLLPGRLYTNQLAPDRNVMYSNAFWTLAFQPDNERDQQERVLLRPLRRISSFATDFFSLFLLLLYFPPYAQSVLHWLGMSPICAHSLSVHSFVKDVRKGLGLSRSPECEAGQREPEATGPSSTRRAATQSMARKHSSLE